MQFRNSGTETCMQVSTWYGRNPPLDCRFYRIGLRTTALWETVKGWVETSILKRKPKEFSLPFLIDCVELADKLSLYSQMLMVWRHAAGSSPVIRRWRAGQFCVRATNCRIPEELAQTSPHTRGEWGGGTRAPKVLTSLPNISLNFETLYHMNSSLWIVLWKEDEGANGVVWGPKRNSISCVAAWEEKYIFVPPFTSGNPLWGLGAFLIFTLTSFVMRPTRFQLFFWPYLMVFWFLQPNSHWSST